VQEKLRILNLEDNPNDSELVQARLEEEGIACDITRVDTEPEFVAALARKDGFDLILADYKLPSFGGLQALALAQEKRPEIPFILISGTIDEELAVECLKGGAADYILKDKLFRLGASVRRALSEAEEKAERKRAEDALRESSQFNRQIIDSAQEGIIVYGPDLKYLVWNPFMEQLTGIPASEVIGRHPLDVFPFLKDAGVLASVEKALRGEIAEAKRFPFAIPMTGRSGWTSDKSAPLRNSLGEIVGVIATVRDITEHVRAEESQRLSEAKYLLLNEGIMDGFVSVDMKGNILEFNRAYRDMLGYSEEELRKRTYVELTPQRWHEVERKIIEDQIMKRGFSDIYEKEYIRKDGTVFPVEFRTYLIRDADSKPVGMWGIVRDISGRKKAENRLQELNACFLEFGTDPGENINRLVALCGKLLEGSCALYNRLDRDMLCSRGKWNVPLDYPSADSPEGHICYDVIRNASDEVFVVRNLPETNYARTDPNVGRYNLETYVGVAVKFAGSFVGALCVVYQRDFLPDEEDKKILGIIASAIGVEEERRIGEQALAAAGREWSASFDAMADGVSVHTADHVIANVNQSLCLMLGKTREELIGKKCCEIFHGQDSPIEDCPLERTKESKRKEYIEIFEPTIDRWLAVSTAPMLDDAGNVTRIVHTVRDITGRKQSEDKLREEAEVSDSLLQIVEALNATLDEKALVQTLTQITPRYLKFDRVSVFLGDEDLDTFTFSGGYGFAPPQEGYLLSKVFRKGDFPAVDKLMNGETVCIENARETDLLPKDLVNTLELGSTIMVPISYRGKVIGAIVGTYKTPNALKLKDLTLLKGLADGIGVALQNSRLYRESTHRLMQLSGKMETIKAMAQLDREILASTDRKTILQTAAALVNRIIPCERVAVVLMEGDYYSVATEWGLGQLAGKKYPVRGSHCEAFRQNQMSIYSPDISAEKCAYHSEQSLLGIRSVLLVPLVTRDGVAGFLDLGTSQHGKLTPVDLSTAESIASQIAVALENARLFEDLEQLLVSTITSLASAIDAKSPWTKGHSERVTKYAVEIGEEMGLSEHELERLKLSGLLHDVGKIGTYDILLDKPSRLTDEEFELVKKHPRKGAEILSPIKQLTDIIPGVRHHHERYDGRGYPDGLTGEEIPLQARILCVADSFDSMTADRPYRPAPGTAYAISEFERCRGTQFDPMVVEAFLRVLSRRDSNGQGKAHE
jgi:PAS domain S-box-containing protein